jgi:5'(3')-deoxyribonucleotidase
MRYAKFAFQIRGTVVCCALSDKYADHMLNKKPAAPESAADGMKRQEDANHGRNENRREKARRAKEERQALGERSEGV